MLNHDELSTSGRRVRSSWKIAAYTGCVILVCALTVYVVTHAFFDGFLRDKIIGALRQAYPAYTVRIGSLHYHVLRNRIDCDSIEIVKNDSTESCSIAWLALSGIDRMQFLRGGGDTPQELASSYAEARGIKLTFVHAEYELSCSHVAVSVPDSTVALEQLELHPWSDDEQFFAASKFRTTRFLLDAPKCNIAGVECAGFLTGTAYRVRTVKLDSISLGILVNKAKPDEANSSPPGMPNEALAEITQPVLIDSLGITNGHVMYDERFEIGGKPAAIWWDNLTVSAQRIGNVAGGTDTAFLSGHGTFLSAAVMNINMTLPLAPGTFSANFSGSLSEIALTNFNSFIEIAEHKRLKTGTAYGASFAVDVKNGRATGTVHAAYKDLKIVAIDGRTGSESGVGNTIFSFLANNIRLRTTNLPDKSGASAVGKVTYMRKPGDTFTFYIWVALRSGVQDLIGF